MDDAGCLCWFIFCVCFGVKDLRNDTGWVSTSFDGPCSSSDRGAFWAELTMVASKWNRPWGVGGDFNVTRFSSEKKVGCSISPAMRVFFRLDWIQSQEFNDLPLGGAKYTWSNMQDDPVMCRLDRFLVTTE